MSTPRRNRLDLLKPAEVSIHSALVEVERLGADERLTEVVTLLSKAKDLVGDYIDDKITTDFIDSIKS